MKGRDVTGILVTVTIIEQAEISLLPKQGEGVEAVLEARDPQVDIVPGGILDILVHLGSQQLPSSEPGKDEFGRDIRPDLPQSPPTTDYQSPSPTQKHPPEQSKDSRSPLAAITDQNPSHDSNSISSAPVNANLSSTKQSGASLVTNANEPEWESFNPLTFDFTSPAEWETLGKMWQVTNGYLPSTEELMQFVMTSATTQATSNSGMATQNSHMNPSATGRGYPRSGGRGRGGFPGGRGGNYGVR